MSVRFRSRVLDQLVRYRTPLYHPAFPLIFLWSQKSGCTTLVKWFFAQVGLLEEARQHHRWVHRYENEVYKARKGYQAALRGALKARTHRVVKVVRDPSRRAPSAFLVLGERGAVGPNNHWVKRHWTLVHAWLAERGEDPAQGISFLRHLEMLEELDRRAAHKVNPHLAQQYLAGEEDYLDEVVPIERFADWAKALAAREPRVEDLCLATIADSHHHHTVDPEVTGSLGPTPEAAPILPGAFAEGLFPAGDAFVNARSLPQIRSAYAKDFDAYGAYYGLGRDSPPTQ